MRQQRRTSDPNRGCCTLKDGICSLPYECIVGARCLQSMGAARLPRRPCMLDLPFPPRLWAWMRVALYCSCLLCETRRRPWQKHLCGTLRMDTAIVQFAWILTWAAKFARLARKDRVKANQLLLSKVSKEDIHFVCLLLLARYSRVDTKYAV